MEKAVSRKYKGLPCAWCGDPYYDRAHVPTRFLIPKTERNNPNWPILPSCRKCNEGLKLHEEWLTVHFASLLYDYSDVARKMFDGPVTKHFQNSKSIAIRYNNYLSLVQLHIDGKSQGLKTRINMSEDDWMRIEYVAEMFARGLYYWHTGISAKGLKAKIVYLTPQRFKNFLIHIRNLKIVPLFPITFEYSYGIVDETKEAAFLIMIYNKPCFQVLLIKEEKYLNMEDKIKSGEIVPSRDEGIEIF